jgi:Tfp pilus assembly protein PilX
MRDRLRQEDGIALVMALAFTVALSILVFGMTSYVTSNQKSAQNSGDDAVARSYAEAALNTAYSRINYANSPTGLLTGISPTKPNILGCGTGTAGASDCSSITPLCLAFTSACPGGTYTPTAGTGAVYAYYTGTNPATFAGVSAAAATWVIVATGYARNSSGNVDAKSLRGTVTISAANAGAVASVWNHVFFTAPKVAGVCQQTFNGNSTVLDMPIYTIGNFCITGNNLSLKETSGGQAVDLQVGGSLIYGGTGDAVGDFSTSPATGITSGVVVGNCASSITATTKDCATNFDYKVKSVDTYVSQSDPELSDTQIKSNYTNFDPGPKNTCLTGTTPSPPAGGDAVFDSTPTSGEGSTSVPDNSGSVTNGTAFDLTPATNYACISKHASGGYLIWNNGSSSFNVTVGSTTITVPSKTLAISGSIFFDSPVKISQAMTYKGTAVIMAAGQIQFPTSNITICAQNTSCSYTNWQGSTSNTDMMTLATVLKNSSKAIDWEANNMTYMGSLWCPTSSTIYYGGNAPITIGPMSIGSMTVIANTFTFKPLPIITNMPIGAPVPPNVSATISPLNVIG